MQRTSDRSSLLTRRSRRGLALVAVVGLAILLGACGGDSDDASDTSATSTDKTTTSDTSTDAGGSTDEGSTVDICGEITQADMEAIIPDATFTNVAPNSAIPAPTCDYSVDIGGVDGAVIQIQLTATDPAYFDSQRDLQTDAAEVDGVPDAFSFNDAGTILVKTDSGVFTIIRGVEPTAGGEPVSAEQMTAIAQQVAEL